MNLPTPYFEDREHGITLYCGDCRDILPLLPDKSVDLVLTDPPYGIGEDGGVARTRGKTRPNHEYGGWDSEIPSRECFDELRRVSNRQAIFGGNFFTEYLPASRGWMYWRKLMGGDFADGELIWTSLDRTLREFTFPNKGLKTVHPTQKPIAVVEWLMGFFQPFDSVLDPFCGSGTTLVAAKQLGRKAIGIEISEKYCAIAVDRLRQMELFRF